MKGKIILAFVFALLALTLIGLVGQSTLTQLIVSIKKDSEPNEKLTALKEVLGTLSEAESSVRTYTITRESDNLIPFYESISSIDYKINGLYETIDNREQLMLIDSMKTLIERKYTILKELIDIKKDHGAEKVLERVLANIAKLREKDSIPEPLSTNPSGDTKPYYDRIKKVDVPEIVQEKKKLSIFQRIFGGGSNDKEEPAVKEETAAAEPDPSAITEAPPEGQNITRSYIPTISKYDLNSSDIGQIITKIGRENNRNVKAIKEQELALTTQDNELTQHIRKIANKIEDREKKISVSRAEAAQEATEKAIDIISITWIAALAIFALLLFIIFNDITRNKRNKERLKNAKDRAENLAKVKEEFLSNMSHEIRTPLNSIIGYTEQLGFTTLAPEQQKYLTSIHHSGNHLLRIINDILDYAKLQAGKLSLEAIGFTIAENIEEVLEAFESDLKKKGLEVTYTIDESIPEVLIGDPVRFRQILINLLSNAIKFTSSGTIAIRVEQQEIKYDVVRLVLTVADCGIGIPADKLNSIFQNFAQVDSSTTRKYGGTGLGLSIVKKIVDMHDGHIHVESLEGKGTTFTIDLRYKIGTLQDLRDAPENAPFRDDQLSGKKIMVVDDQEYNLQLIKLIFDKWHVNTTLLNSGKEAIERLRDEDYDLILMDIHMPEMSGPEATQQIRNFERHSQTPVVALTAAASKEEAEKCLQAGMDDYLLKPFTQHALYMNLTKILDEQNYKPAEISSETSKYKAARQNSFSVDDLNRLSNGDTSFVSNMLKIFRKNFEIDLWDLQKGLEEKNFKQLKAKAHKMIPPCLHLHLSHLAALLKEIELSSEGEDFDKINELVSEVAESYDALRPVIKEEINKNQKYTSESAA